MQKELTQIRWLTRFIIFGLIVSGLTAFPLMYELNIPAFNFLITVKSFSLLVLKFKNIRKHLWQSLYIKFKNQFLRHSTLES